MKNKWLSKILAAVCMMAILLTGCGSNVDSDAALVTINDGEDTISYGYGYFYARYMQAMFDSLYLSYMGDQMWSQTQGEQTMEELTKDDAMDSMEEEYILRQHAKEYDVKITDDEEKEITKAAKTFMEENSEKALKELGATQEIVEEYLRNQTYKTKVTAAIKESAGITEIPVEEGSEDEERPLEELLEEKETEHYNSVMDGWKKDIKWKVDEKLWDTVKFDTLFKPKS